MFIDPISRKRIQHARHTGDIVYPQDGPASISQEVIPVIGGWKDFTGSGGPSTSEQMFAGQADKLWGTDAFIDGARLKELDVTGHNKATTRRRQFMVYQEDPDTLSKSR